MHISSVDDWMAQLSLETPDEQNGLAKVRTAAAHTHHICRRSLVGVVVNARVENCHVVRVVKIGKLVAIDTIEWLDVLSA